MTPSEQLRIRLLRAKLCEIFNVFPEELEYNLPGGISLEKVEKLEALITQELKEAERVASEAITYDSWSLGWEDNDHLRELVLIKGGKVIHREKRSDEWLRWSFHHGDVIVEYHIIDWAEQAIKALTPTNKEADK